MLFDGVAKMGAPTPEVAPLLLDCCQHLAAGLAPRAAGTALHAHLRAAPPSLLLKLASVVAVRPCSQSTQCAVV